MFRKDSELVLLIQEHERQMAYLLIHGTSAQFKELEHEFAVLLLHTLDREGVRKIGNLKPRSAPSDLVSGIREQLQEILPASPITLTEEEIQRHFLPGRLYDDDIWVGEGAVIDPSVRLVGPALIGKGCHVCAKTIVIFSCLINAWIGDSRPDPEFRGLFIDGPTITIKTTIGPN